MDNLVLNQELNVQHTTLHETGSIPPSIWGHAGWKFLFSMAYVYPEQNPDEVTMKNYYFYFSHLRNMLPCGKCRTHYTEYLNSKPLQFYLYNRESLFYWLLGLHNRSNSDAMISNQTDAIKHYLPQIMNLNNQKNLKNKTISKKCTSC